MSIASRRSRNSQRDRLAATAGGFFFRRERVLAVLVGVMPLVLFCQSSLASMSLSATSLSYGTVTVGTASASQSVTMTNTGGTAVTISSIAVTGTNASAFVFTNTCGTSLAAGAKCTISGYFEPTVAGSVTATVTITDNARRSPQSITLSGTGAAPTVPVVTLSATSLSYGTIAAGTSSSSQSVTMTNTGTATLTISSITVTGTNASSFVFANTCGTSLAAGANCTISGTFAPTAAGTMAATITITDNASGSTQTITLSGTAVVPTVTLSATTLAYGTIAAGTSSSSQSVTMINTGTATLTISSIAVTGTNASSFVFTNTCGTSLAAGANCTISGSFAPAVAGTMAAAITITDNASGSTQSITLSGTAVVPTVTLSATSLSYGTVAVGASSNSQSVTLTNTGSVPVTIISIAVTGTNASSFVSTNTCGTSLAAGANCTISGTFAPTAAGTMAATITITDNASGSTQTITLSGTAAVPTVTLSATSLSYGAITLGASSTSQSVTMTNTGSVPVTISSIALTGSNASSFVFANTCGTSLAAAASCKISGSFTPSAAGAMAAAITITDNASGSTQTIALSGTAAASTLTLSATSLSYGTISVGTSSSSQSVTMTNAGSTAMTISSIGVTGKNASSFVFANNCGTSLAAGANCTIHGHFAPAATGPLTAAITIVDSGPASPQTITLSGTGYSPTTVSLSAASLAYGNVAPGTISGSQSVTLTNTGAATLYISGIGVTGTGASSFVFANTCGTSLAAGANCTIHGHFAPTASGTMTAAIAITDTAPASPQTITLTGTGGAPPAISLSATSLAYGNMVLGTTSGSQSVTLTNTGATTLNFSSMSLTGTGASSFIFATSCGTSLVAGANCSIHGHFAPASAGPLTAVITIIDNAATSQQTIKLTGTGDAPTTVSLSATSLVYGNLVLGTMSGSQSATLTNTGAATLYISSIGLTGTDASSFVFANSCGTSLAVGASCTIHGHFAPTVAGTMTAAVTITDNSPSSPQSIALTGTGAAASSGATLGINATSVGFGNVALNTPTTQSVILTSTGTGSVTVNSVTLTGTGFTMSEPTLPVTLAPSKSATIDVQFDPTTAGAAAGTLTISSTSTINGTVAIPLTGTGTVASYAVDLSWSAPPSSSDPVAGYNVLRSPSGSSSYQLLNSTVDAQMAYTDSTVQSGQSYDYEVESVDASGVESAPSSPIAVTIP